MKERRCPTCRKGALRPGTTKHTMRLGEQTFWSDLPVSVCDACGEELMTTATLGAFEEGVAEHLAKYGPATPESFRFMRKAIGLSAKAVAELLDAAPETISRWENGRQSLDLYAWVTLGMLVIDHNQGFSTTRDRLQALKSNRLAKTVPITVPSERRATK